MVQSNSGSTFMKNCVRVKVISISLLTVEVLQRLEQKSTKRYLTGYILVSPRRNLEMTGTNI